MGDIVAIIGVLVMAGGWVWHLATTFRDVREHGRRIAAIEAEQRQVAKDIAELKTDVKWIRRTLEHQPSDRA